VFRLSTTRGENFLCLADGLTVDLQAIVLFLKETAGKDFNPLLINNFLKALNGIGAFGEAACKLETHSFAQEARISGVP
jgi:hypothetical protein